MLLLLVLAGLMLALSRGMEPGEALRFATAAAGASVMRPGTLLCRKEDAFMAEEGIDCAQLVYKLNKLLPYDIAVQKVEQVGNDLHARFSATSRTYHYYIHTVKDPFRKAYSCEIHYPLDFAKMNEAARLLMDWEDFGTFCKSGADVKTTICHVTLAEWHQTSPSEWYFEITANRFLRNMVRAVVGTLVEVGRGRLALDEFRKVLASGRRTEAGESMPGHALFLEDIKY